MSDPDAIQMLNLVEVTDRLIEELRTVMAWMAGNDTGISSKAIAATMTGTPISKTFGASPPSDPSDLGRCLRLLALFPQWTPERFTVAMSAVSHDWRCFTEDWPMLAASMADEVGVDWSKGKRAQKTYDLMQATWERAARTRPRIPDPLPSSTGRAAE